MDTIDLTQYVPGSDFYELYPQFRIAFSEESSTMWCIAFMHHNTSIYANLPYTNRLEAVRATINDKYREPEEFTETVNLFKSLTLSKSRRFLYEWEIKLEERSNFLASIPYTAETYELLDKMMGNTSKIWDQYRKCLKDVQQEDEIKVIGDSRESLADTGEI